MQAHRMYQALAAALLALTLQGCERGADSGATANPVAPGRPGTGNPTVVLEPQPGSINESPQVGGSTRNVPEGITGSGGPTRVPGGTQAREHPSLQPGSGLDGGLGGPPAAAASAPAR